MQIASWLLVTSSLVAPAAQPATNATAIRPSEARPAVSFAAAQQRPTIAAQPATSSPTYRFGLGGNIVVSNYGVGGSARYWINKHIGMSMASAWYRGGRQLFGTSQFYSTQGATTFQTTSTVTASPSLMFMLNQTDENREVSLRPYFGVGAGYLHAAHASYQIVTSTGAPVTYSGVSEHVFGGAEMMFRDYPNLAISGELIYYNIPNTFLNRIYVDGLNFQIAAHFYIK